MLICYSGRGTTSRRLELAPSSDSRSREQSPRWAKRFTTGQSMIPASRSWLAAATRSTLPHPPVRSYRPPLGVDLVAAAGVIEVAATVYSNIELIGLADGDRFLVHGGAGGIGSFAIQYAKSIGATVITTGGSEDKLNYCRSIGADHAISYRGDWPAAVREVAADGVHMILDNMGAKYLNDHVQLLATDGALVIIGMQGGRKATLDLAALTARRGLVTANSLRARSVEEKAAICRGLVQNVWPLIADDTIKQPPLTIFPLAEAAAAHARLESGDNIGKIILSVAR